MANFLVFLKGNSCLVVIELVLRVPVISCSCVLVCDCGVSPLEINVLSIVSIFSCRRMLTFLNGSQIFCIFLSCSIECVIQFDARAFVQRSIVVVFRQLSFPQRWQVQSQILSRSNCSICHIDAYCDYYQSFRKIFVSHFLIFKNNKIELSMNNSHIAHIQAPNKQRIIQEDPKCLSSKTCSILVNIKIYMLYAEMIRLELGHLRCIGREHWELVNNWQPHTRHILLVLGQEQIRSQLGSRLSKPRR